MKVLAPVLVLGVLAISMLAGSTVYADGYYRGRDHHRVFFRDRMDVVIGGPVWGPAWYYPPYYYYPGYDSYYSPAVEESPAYMEREGQSESSVPTALWYYCPESKKYYPYVKECPGGWQTVPAEPPSGLRR